MKRTRKWRHRLIIGSGIFLIVVAVALIVADSALDEPIRNRIERTANEKLKGYTLTIGHADFHLFGASLDVKNMMVFQDAHPDTPVMFLPRLDASIQWKEIIFGRVVADFEVDRPTLHVDLTQLRAEYNDDVPVEERGWQAAVEAIYPFKINHLVIREGALVYIDDDPGRPLELSRVYFNADNIRNIHSPERTYPSPVHLDAVVFDEGYMALDGNADFLARPMMGTKGRMTVKDVELSYFTPLLDKLNLVANSGTLSAEGEFEYNNDFQSVDLEEILIAGSSVDYIVESPVPLDNTEMAQQVVHAAEKLKDNPTVVTRVRSLRVTDSKLTIKNKTQNPPYDIFWSNIDVHIRDFSNQPEEGKATGELTGLFMGSGKTAAAAEFLPASKSPDFKLQLSIEGTEMKAMNDLFRAHGNFDVVEGLFSFYSEVRVKDGRIAGYVKPLFQDVDVYDAKQDKGKNPFRKMWEGIVGGIAKLLENDKRDEVATRADISGWASDPDASILQIVGGLMRNAFFRAILPGLEDEADRPRSRREKQRERRT